MFQRQQFARQVARRVAMQHQSKRLGHSHAPDTSYDPAINAKFMLPPVPKDGIYRRRRIDLDAHGPWHRHADTYIIDSHDLVTWFDRNGPTNLTPHQILKRFFVIGFALISPALMTGTYFQPLYFGHFYQGISDRSKFHPPHPVASLVSHPHAQPRTLVTEY